MGHGRAESDLTDWPSWRAWGALLVTMALSASFVLWFGRNIVFTADEATLISRAADLGIGDLVDPYVGHLIPVALIAYKALLETVGTTHYAPFQILTLIAIFLLGAGVLVWASRRLPQYVALVPAVLLVFFPADVLHFIAGNGFVILLPLALGTWALVLWDRGDLPGDVGAALLLALAISTYTTGVAFAVGLVAFALLKDRKRLWVGAVPLLAYAVWRVLIASGSGDAADADPNWANLLLLPAWTFQSVGDILVALSGIGFDFAEARSLGDATAGDLAGPVFATGFFALVLMQLRRDGFTDSFWSVVMIAIALFASQVLVWGSLDGRGEPGEERYLYPGAVVVLLLMIELVRPVRWDRTGLAVLWSITAVALVSALGFLLNEIDRREAGTGIARAQVTAMQILGPTDAPGLQRAKTVVKNDFDPVATARFEGLGFDERDLPDERALFTEEVDRFLVVALDVELEPLPPDEPVGTCRPATREGPVTGGTIPDRVFLPRSATILESSRDLTLTLGRYGARASRKLGLLAGGVPALLVIPPDRGSRPWFLQAGPESGGALADLSLCRTRPD